MGNLVQAEAQGLLHTSLLTATDTYTAPTGPMKLALIVTGGTTSSSTTAGTEASGGSYGRQTISLGASTYSAGPPGVASTANTNAISFTNMPAGTIHQIEIWDSTSGTPIRRWWGNLNVDKTLGAGDTISFAIGAVTISIG